MSALSDPERLNFDPSEIGLAQSRTDLFVAGLIAGMETADEVGDCIAGTVVSRHPSIRDQYDSLVDNDDINGALAMLKGIYAGVDEAVRRKYV